jgi:Domain of unknown function (DUF4258)
MKIEYSEHALEQLFEREISKKDVESALRYGRSSPGHDGAMMAIRTWDNNLSLVVIYCIKGLGVVIVLTVYKCRSSKLWI